MRNITCFTFLVFACLGGLWFSENGTSKENGDQQGKLIQVAESKIQWTGVAVSREGRIFVNYPRWLEDLPYSVAEITGNGEVKPYPSQEWNNWNSSLSPEDHFVCVQSVCVDANNDLWILDPASPLLQGVVAGGPKLVRVDLKTNQVAQVIRFDTSIAPPNSYLNDLRVEIKTNIAYITDSGEGAIVVVDLNNGNNRRLLAGHYSTTAEDSSLTIAGRKIPIMVHSDGIALDTRGGYLYYQALSGHTLYRIKTEYLQDTALTEENLGKLVEKVGNSGASDGLLYKDGYIYLTSIELNAIRRIAPGGEPELVVQDSLLQWPDSFAPGPDGSIYLTTSRIGFPEDGQPYRLFKLYLN
jgi:sugar lactone lactonase YvrE